MGNKGAILTITIIFVVILAIISGVSIILMTNHARISEFQIKRTKAYYTAEAGIAYAVNSKRTGANTTGPWELSLNGMTVSVTATAITTASGKEHHKLISKVKY